MTPIYFRKLELKQRASVLLYYILSSIISISRTTIYQQALHHSIEHSITCDQGGQHQTIMAGGKHEKYHISQKFDDSCSYVEYHALF